MSVHNRLALLATSLFVAFTLGSCASDVSGIPQSTNTSSRYPGTATPAPPGDRLAPLITAKQLDLSSAKKAPCDLVPDSSLRTFDVVAHGRYQDAATGPSCAYDAISVNDALLAVSIFTKTGGIEGLYQRRSSFTRFETGMLDGYPTVNTLQGIQPGACQISVAVNDTELISVDFSVSPGRRFYGNACPPATQILALALDGAGG